MAKDNNLHLINYDNAKEELVKAQGLLNDLRRGDERQQILVETEIAKLKKTNLELQQKAILKSLTKVKAAQTFAENELLQLQLDNIELQQKAKIDSLKQYEIAEANARNKRLAAENNLQKTIAEKQVAAGVTADSKLGKLIAASETTKAAKAMRQENANTLFAKGSTGADRLLAVNAMFSSYNPETGESVSLNQLRKANKAKKNGSLAEYTAAQNKLAQYETYRANKRSAIEKDTTLTDEEKTNKLASFDETTAKNKAAREEAVAAALKKTGLTKNVADMAAADKGGGVIGQIKDALKNGFAGITAGLANLYDKLVDTADQIALNKSSIDGRLQGATSSWSSISDAVASTMLDGSVRSEKLAENIYAAVQKGIARDVESMGAIETIKTRVAPTFDTFNSTVLRLIRIQNQNTTYARLGMEASLTQMFNELYSTTEYLSNLASSVRNNLEEAQALMGGVEAVNFEYQVQKWLGSLSSAGMSDSAVTAISNALGKLAAGQIEGITEGGTGNLLIMAANNSNLSISDILANGLDESETNQLLNAMVGYMQELVSEANGNLVVQQQLAKVFGMSASDLKTAVNLATVYKTQDELLAERNLNYGNFVYAAGTSGGTVTLAERLSNMWANTKYSIATEIANSPVMYGLTRVVSILDGLVGGIDIPTISIMGTSVDLKTSVSEIMKSASLVTAAGKTLFAALNGGGFGAATALAAKGAGSGVAVSAGKATSSSGSGIAYNGSIDDMESSATAESKDKSKKLTVQAKEESEEVSNKTINENIVGIYNIVKSVVDGDELFHVKMSGGLNGAAETMKVEVVNYDQFVADRYSWNADTSTLTDTWADNWGVEWTKPVGSY